MGSISMIRSKLGLPTLLALLMLFSYLSTRAAAQDPQLLGAAPKKSEMGSGPGGQEGSGFGPWGPGAGPNFMRQDRKLVKEFDRDGDKVLNREEREAAREALKKEREKEGKRRAVGGFGPGGFGPPGIGLGGFGPPAGFGRTNQAPAKRGVSVTPAEVKSYPRANLYDPNVVRTLFLDFENQDWEAELQDFHGTDVEVPATLMVDGEKYPGVGVHFRGMSSYMMVPTGYKRSLNVSLDFVNSKQRLYGYKTLNLLNGHEDPSFLGTVLYSSIARQHIPAPKANLVKVVINGENWGIYTNVQQFDKIFLDENFKTSKGARWKVRGIPFGGGGLDYVGDDIAEYKRRYEIKSRDDEKDWKALVQLANTLTTTPTDQLEEALKPLIDIDGLLWFLALDVSLINCDGYWIRASDYSLHLNEKGIFHVIPHDMNEAFRQPAGPGFGPPPGFDPPPGGPPPVGVGGAGAPGFWPPPEGFSPPGGGPSGTDGLGEAGGPERADNPGSSAPQQAGSGRFGRQGDFGMRMRAKGVELDPLVGLDDARKPLRSKVLSVPTLQARYLQYVRAIAEQLDWSKLGPVVAKHRAMIDNEVKIDTRKLETHEAFLKATADTAESNSAAPEQGWRAAPMPLRAFADQRRSYLLNYSPKKAVENHAGKSSASTQSRKAGLK
jgi:spore coat protein CotH